MSHRDLDSHAAAAMDLLVRSIAAGQTLLMVTRRPLRASPARHTLHLEKGALVEAPGATVAA